MDTPLRQRYHFPLYRSAIQSFFLLFCATGDAMGMNMVSKGCEAAVAEIRRRFRQARLVTLTGNTCTDKKSSARNWIEGRGKSVVVSRGLRIYDFVRRPFIPLWNWSYTNTYLYIYIYMAVTFSCSANAHDVLLPSCASGLTWFWGIISLRKITSKRTRLSCFPCLRV